MRRRVAVLFGGCSVEHEISVITALQLMEAMDTLDYDIVPVYVDQKGHWYAGKELLKREFYDGLPGCLENITKVTLLPQPGVGGLTILKNMKVIPIDIIFLAFHGKYGEDGCVQGLIEMADIPYTGCGVLTSAVTMNKSCCKAVLANSNIPVLPWVVIKREESRQSLGALLSRIKKCEGLENFPYFIKPCNLGSSVGVGKASDEKAFAEALARVFKYDTDAIVEPCIEDLMEVNISVLEGDTPQVSVVEIPVAISKVLTYEDKYLRGGKNKLGGVASDGMAGLVRDIDPEYLDAKLKESIRNYALAAFMILECAGVVRFDFIIDCKTNTVYFNEVNPLPGSLAYYLWEKSSPRILYTEMLDWILKRAEIRKARVNAVHKDMEFKALR